MEEYPCDRGFSLSLSLSLVIFVETGSTVLAQFVTFYVNAEYGSDGYTGTSGAQPSGGSTVGPWKTLTHAFLGIGGYEINPGTFVTLSVAARKNDTTGNPIVHDAALSESFPITVPPQVNMVYDQTWSEIATPLIIDTGGSEGFYFNTSRVEPASRFDGTPPDDTPLQRGIIIRNATTSAIQISPPQTGTTPVGIPPGNSFERIQFENNGQSIYAQNSFISGTSVPTINLTMGNCWFTSTQSGTYQNHIRVQSNSQTNGFPTATITISKCRFTVASQGGSYETAIRLESVGPILTGATSCGTPGGGSLITANVSECEFLGLASNPGGSFQGIHYGIHSLGDNWLGTVQLSVSNTLFDQLGASAIQFGRRGYSSCLLSVTNGSVVRNCGKAVNLLNPTEADYSSIAAWSEPGNTCTTSSALASDLSMSVTDSTVELSGMHGVLLHHRIAGPTPVSVPARGSHTALTIKRNEISNNGIASTASGSGVKVWIEQGLLKNTSRIEANRLLANCDHGIDFLGESSTPSSTWPIEINGAVASNEVIKTAEQGTGVHYGIRSRYAGGIPTDEPGGLHIVQNTLILNRTADIFLEVVGSGNDSFFSMMGNLAPFAPTQSSMGRNFVGFAPSPRQPMSSIDFNFGSFDQTNLNATGCNATLAELNLWIPEYFTSFSGGDFSLVLRPPQAVVDNPAVDRVLQGITGQGTLDFAGAARVNPYPGVNACVQTTDSDSGAHEL